MDCTPPCSSMVTASMCFDVDASADTLWDTFLDIHNIPSFVNNIQSLSIDNSKIGTDPGAMHVGSEIRFIRERGYQHIKAKPMTMQYRITALSKSAEQYILSASISSGVTQAEEAPRNRDGARTGTYAIFPVSENTCKLVWTFAAAPGSWHSSILRFFFGKFFVYLVKRVARQEMEDYFKEAARRQLRLQGGDVAK